MKNIPLPDLYYLENPDLKQLFRIMRISIFLLFFCLFSLMAENSHSQNARVTINRSDAPLESILNEIESQTDYLFIYKEDVNVKMRKSIHVSSKPVASYRFYLQSHLLHTRWREIILFLPGMLHWRHSSKNWE